MDNFEITPGRRPHLAEFGGNDAALRRPFGSLRGWRPLGPVEPHRLFGPVGKLCGVASRRRFGRPDRRAAGRRRAEGRAPRRSGIGPDRAIPLAAALALLALARLDVELAAVDFEAVERGD